MKDERPYGCLIIDEVDSILLDEGSKLAMMSSAFTGMDKLQPIYHFIRSVMLEFDSQQTYYCVGENLFHCNGDGDPTTAPDMVTDSEPRREYLKRKIESFIRNLLGIDEAELGSWKMKEYLQIPPHLLKYAESQISNWAEAVITAEALEENKDYIVIHNEMESHVNVASQLWN